MCKTLSFAVLMALLFASVTLAQVSVGDVVNLKERHLDIPAHPAPGDSHVHFRFASESQAIVLDIDSATTWVRIQGTNTVVALSMSVMIGMAPPLIVI